MDNEEKNNPNLSKNSTGSVVALNYDTQYSETILLIRVDNSQGANYEGV